MPSQVRFVRLDGYSQVGITCTALQERSILVSGLELLYVCQVVPLNSHGHIPGHPATIADTKRKKRERCHDGREND